MKDSKRSLGLTCGIVAIALVAVSTCAVLVVGLSIYLRNREAISQVLASPTDTPSATATSLPTHTTTPVPPTPTPSPTSTPTTLPSTSTPSITPSPSATEPPPPAPTDTPVPTDTSVPTDEPAPQNTPPPEPSDTSGPPPTETPVPTPQAEPFLPIGTTVGFSPEANGATGSSVLFSPRQFTMINFSYDGKCPIADIRLGMEGFPKPPVEVLLYLEERPYENESFPVPVPAELPAGSANAMFVFCDSRDEMLAWGPLIPPQH